MFVDAVIKVSICIIFNIYCIISRLYRFHLTVKDNLYILNQICYIRILYPYLNFGVYILASIIIYF